MNRVYFFLVTAAVDLEQADSKHMGLMFSPLITSSRDLKQTSSICVFQEL